MARAPDERSLMNQSVYIHELIDIRGHNRAKYMHHMTANWVPVALAERNQRCFGVWGTVGSTSRWPEVVNMWEFDGWDGLAANFAHEFSHESLQDPSLAEWWAQAAEFRRGGFDRILVPAPWTSSIGELIAGGVSGEVFAQEVVTVPPGAACDYLEALEEVGRAAVESFGFTLTGAFRTAMWNDTECIVIWAIPDWATWAAYEHTVAQDPRDERLAAWHDAQAGLEADYLRTLMVQAPLSPLRIGRQPAESDRLPLDQL
jgi:hypothetical protein